MKRCAALWSLLVCTGVQAAAPIPSCQNKRQCDATWAAAQVALSTATGMPNRIATNGRIETFPSTSDHLLSGAVAKLPSGQEGYKFVPELSCHGPTPYDDRTRASTEFFNTLTINAVAALGPLPPPNATKRSAAGPGPSATGGNSPDA